MNSFEILWVSSPDVFQEGWTWLFDNCGGHGDTYGHYHYHAPPLCLLKSLGLPVPKNSSWWKFEGEKAWPKSGPEVQVGWAPWSGAAQNMSNIPWVWYGQTIRSSNWGGPRISLSRGVASFVGMLGRLSWVPAKINLYKMMLNHVKSI